MRYELHEFGEFTVELWESNVNGHTWTKFNICLGSYVVRTNREPRTLEDAKQDIKMWLVSATARWQQHAKDWDHKKQSTSA